MVFSEIEIFDVRPKVGSHHQPAKKATGRYEKYIVLKLKNLATTKKYFKQI